MGHITFLPCLSKSLSRGGFPVGVLDVPPKLPETTNLVLTNNRKDHNETKAMKVRTRVENKSPPLRNLH